MGIKRKDNQHFEVCEIMNETYLPYFAFLAPFAKHGNANHLLRCIVGRSYWACIIPSGPQRFLSSFNFGSVVVV